MFSQRIVGSDEFLEMPVSSRELYFQLGMYADDDGFVSPQKVVRMVSANPDDLKVLKTKNFIIPFEKGVIVITNWKENNYIQKDRYQPTIHQEEMKQLSCIQNVYKMDTQVRLGKDRIGKDTTTAPKPAVEVPFSLKDEIKKLEDNSRRDLNIIALYLEKKKPDIRTRDQFKVALRRHLRPAKDLTAFDNTQILKACSIAEKEYPLKWTIETLVKILTK